MLCPGIHGLGQVPASACTDDVSTSSETLACCQRRATGSSRRGWQRHPPPRCCAGGRCMHRASVTAANLHRAGLSPSSWPSLTTVRCFTAAALSVHQGNGLCESLGEEHAGRRSPAPQLPRTFMGLLGHWMVPSDALPASPSSSISYCTSTRSSRWEWTSVQYRCRASKGSRQELVLSTELPPGRLHLLMCLRSCPRH